MDTDSYMPIVKTDDIYEDISSDVEKLCNTLNYDERRRKKSLSVGKKKQKSNMLDEI